MKMTTVTTRKLFNCRGVITLLCILSRNDPRDLLPGKTYFCPGVILPLLALCLSFFAALSNTIWVATYLSDEAGQLCKHESIMFFEGAKLYMQVTLGMLSLQFLVILWVCSLLLCRGRQSHVWTSIPDTDAIAPGSELSRADRGSTKVSP